MKDHVTPANVGKFMDPIRTAKGETRATVGLDRLDTLWFNAGTLCNIACVNCYIDSSPTADQLSYLSAAEVTGFLDEVAGLGWDTREIGFTGGEPFMNPEFLTMLRTALSRGFEVLVLTNAMQPMQRPAVWSGLVDLHRAFGAKLTLRVSLDHWSAAEHDAVRGAGSFAKTIEGMRRLRDAGLQMAVAARKLFTETDEAARAGFAALFAREGFAIDAHNPAQTVLFPEMDTQVEVPEITTACWGILDVQPSSVMCASSRMVVKHKGRAPSVVACTLLPYDPQFDLGPSLAGAAQDVALNHPHCAKFCVLGGASCSA